MTEEFVPARRDPDRVRRILGEAAGAYAQPTDDPPHVLSWDWREQPDLDELARILAEWGIHLHKVDTGSDQYAIVIAGQRMEKATIDEAYRRRFEEEE